MTKYIIIMSLLLSGCGVANKIKNNVDNQFDLNGAELMEVANCEWNAVDWYTGQQIKVTLQKSFYSTGAVNVKCSATRTSDYIGGECLPNDLLAVQYFTTHEELSFTDNGNCTKTFY